MPEPARLRLALTGGGTEGNEQLTAITGLILIVLLAALGATIIWIRQLIWLHLFLGLLLLGPVVLKMASTGYRFARYYTGSVLYREKGPPGLAMRLLAPAVVASTVIVFASGLFVMFDGPRRYGAWLTIHKASFFVWLAVTALHLLGHLPRLPRQIRGAPSLDGLGEAARGRAGRWIVLASSIAAGAVIAAVLIPHFGSWTAPGAFPQHHHRG